MHVQKLGTALSNMVMPNIGAFIAWGLITALFIKTGWLTGIFHGLQDPDGWVAKIGGWGAYESGGIVGPMITYLLPVLIGYTGGRMVHGNRGAVVGAIATMGVVAGADVPMFMGAMIMGPLGGFLTKKMDALWHEQDPPRLRDAGRQLLRRNPRPDPGRLRLLRHRPDRLGVHPGRRTTASTSWSSHDLLPLTSTVHRAGQGAVPEQRDQPRRADAAGHHPGAADGQVRSCSCWRPIPGPGLGLLLAYTVFGRGLREGLGPGCGDHPVLRRHPRDLLPVCADEAEADLGHHSRRYDGRVHQCAVRLRPAGARGTRFDHRGLRADGQR